MLTSLKISKFVFQLLSHLNDLVVLFQYLALLFLVEWYSVDKHALITLDSETNVKGSVDLDFIMKVYK